MGFRFRKSKKIFPGVRLNVSKSGISVSAGVKGARVSLNSKGRVTKTVGIPGTGISYSETSNLSKNNSRKPESTTKSTGKKQMDVSFSDDNKNIVIYDGNKLSIKTPKKLFKSSKIMTISVYDLSKCDIQKNGEMSFYDKNKELWNKITINAKCLEEAKLVRKLINMRGANYFKFSKRNLMKTDVDNVYTTYVSGCEYYKTDVKKIYEYFGNNTSEKYYNLTNEQIKLYGGYVYELNPKKCAISGELEEEPTNEYDENAIKVNALIDGKKYLVGYIPKEIAKNLKKDLPKIKRVTLKPKSGRYKYYDIGEYDEDDDGNIIKTGRLKTLVDGYDLFVEIEF